MSILVVIVNYRVASLVVDCLRSIEREVANLPNLQVSVVENGSGDDSGAVIGGAIASFNWSRWCKMEVSNQNLGFAEGNNVPIRSALNDAKPPDYFFLLNPDTVIRPRAIVELHEFMEQNRSVGIAGSRLEDPDGTPQRSAFRFKSPLGELESYARLGPLTKLLKSYVVAPPVTHVNIKTDWVAGASMMVRREVFEQIGLLDKDLFTYFDDIDFCLSALRGGWPTWYVPRSRVVHLVGQSTGVNREARRLPGYLLDARRRFFLKHYSPLYAALADTCMLAGILIASLRVFMSKDPTKLPPKLFLDSFGHSVFRKGFQLETVQPPKPDSK